MDNKKLFLLVSLGFILFLLWQAWQTDYGSKAIVNQEVTTAPASELVASGAGAADVPNASSPATIPTAVPTPTNTGIPNAVNSVLQRGQRIEVLTDVIQVQIDTIGGDLRELALLDYPVAANTPQVPFKLLNDSPTNLFVAQSGVLAGANGPDHHAVFSADQSKFQLAAGANELKVPLHWTSPNGVIVTKTYTFQRASYEIKIDYQVENNTAEPWSGRLYAQFQRTYDKSGESRFIYTYTGGVISSPEKKYEKVKFDKMIEADLSQDIKGGWAAMLQHYFVGAWVPAQNQLNHYYTKVLDGTRYILGVQTPETTLAAGATGTLSTGLYVGPKIQDHLAEIAPSLELTVDYGLLTVIAQPIFWLLEHIHDIVGNWGWSIILLTLLIKLAFYKLSATSYKSMANMRRMQPRIAALKERHGDDRQRMSQAMMEMYKTEKINPLGGCLPVIVQIPVFISLYWVLLESVELRQADFILWLNDLSSPDPYYVLPLLMGITMFVQQKLNPAPPDPLQAKVMSVLPFAFTLFFAFFPAGLVLYWVANNTLSIAQQWYITRKVESASTPVRLKK